MTNTGQDRANQAEGKDHISQAYEAKRAEVQHLVPLAEAAKFLGVSRSTVRRMIAEKKLTGYRVGEQLRVHKLELTTSVRKVRPEDVMTPTQKHAKAARDWVGDDK